MATNLTKFTTRQLIAALKRSYQGCYLIDDNWCDEGENCFYNNEFSYRGEEIREILKTRPHVRRNKLSKNYTRSANCKGFKK